MTVTIFKTYHEVKKPNYVKIETIFNRIRESKYKTIIDQIRIEPDKDKRNKLKSKLPAIAFSGRFVERNNDGLLEHSGLICLDFDDFTGGQLQEQRKKLESDPFIYAVFLSPSANGLKALVKIPTADHLGSFLALQKRYPNIDNACKDVSRLCFESYDPTLYVNEKAKTFTKISNVETKVEKVEVNTPETDQYLIYTKLRKWLEGRGYYFTKGQRNQYVTRLIAACNRFGLAEHVTKGFIQVDFINGSEGFTQSEFEAILKSAYTRLSHQHGTAQFDKHEIIDRKTKVVLSKEIEEVDVKIQDLFTVEDVLKEMIHGFNNGKAKGQTTHYEAIDEIFRFSRGELTVLHGMGNHGKSTILNQLLINRAQLSGERFCYFSPEQYPASDFYDELAETYIGGSVAKGDYQVSKELYHEGIDFINRHFFYIYPEDRTPQNILNTFSKVISKHKVDGVVIDPWNQMDHDFSLRDDQYLSQVLTEFKKYALAENIYFIILAHPRGGLEVKGDGNYKMPYYTHLAGGMMWGNKADNILCYHRPNYRTDPKDTMCVLASQKIKRQRYNGKPGFVEMEYKPHKARFYIDDFNPLENPKDQIPNDNPFEEITDPMLKLRKNGFEEIPF